MRDRDTEFKDDLREVSGIGKKRRGKVCSIDFYLSCHVSWLSLLQGGRRRGVVLSQQVKGLLGEGNQSYVDGDVPEAIRIMLEVIRIEPRAVQAWFVLAKCHEEMGEAQKALQLRIIAAHLSQDPQQWYELADQSR